MAENRESFAWYEAHTRWAQEEERKRIARVLHDGPVQSMANIVWEVDLCEKLVVSDPEKTKDELGKLKKLARNILLELRNAVCDLRLPAGADRGLTDKLRTFLAGQPPNGWVEIGLTVRGEEIRLDPGLEQELLAVLQECLANTRRHAAATRVRVRLRFSPGQIYLSIQDNGVGFDYPWVMAVALAEKRFGIIGIRERVGQMQGKCKFKSAPGKGTRVMVLLPLRQTVAGVRGCDGD